MAQGYCILILPELKIRLPTGSRMEAIVQSPRMMVASELNAWTVEPGTYKKIHCDTCRCSITS